MLWWETARSRKARSNVTVRRTGLPVRVVCDTLEYSLNAGNKKRRIVMVSRKLFGLDGTTKHTNALCRRGRAAALPPLVGIFGTKEPNILVVPQSFNVILFDEPSQQLPAWLANVWKG